MIHSLEDGILRLPDIGQFTFQSITIDYWGVLFGVALSAAFYLTHSKLIYYFLYFGYPLAYSFHVLFGKTHAESAVGELSKGALQSVTTHDLRYATSMWTYAGIMGLLTALWESSWEYFQGKEVAQIEKIQNASYYDTLQDVIAILGILTTSIMTVPNGRAFYDTVHKLLQKL